MNRDETKQLLKILSTSYPNHFKDMSKEDKLDQIDNYQLFFGEYESVVVAAALKNYIRVNQYPPTVAGLQEQIDLILKTDGTAEELWNKVYKAICNSGYQAQEEFENLPACCQKWLGGASALKDLGMTDINVVNTVTRGQFLKTIGEIKDRQEVQDKLPDNVKQALTGALQIGE